MVGRNLCFLLVAAGSAHLANAHTAFTNFFIGGVNQGDGAAVRMNSNPGKSTSPIGSVTSPDMACGVNGETGVARIAAAKAGAVITFEYRSWPNGDKPGSIDISHKGPCAVYMKKVENSAANDTAAGDGWFKIMEDGYDNKTKRWCTEKLIPNAGHLAAKIPTDLVPGYYLMRPELLALHSAAANPPDPQFYIGCAQLFLSSGGSTMPKDTVSIPGYVNLQTPAMTYNIWKKPLVLPFPDFGPPVYTGGVVQRGLEKRDILQTIGLKPEGCVMQNANWCGFMPPDYADQTGCWESSKNCSEQTSSCYSSAPPTGGKNCKNWESYCTDIRTNCKAGIYHGPPSFKPHAPAKPPNLTGGVVKASGLISSSSAQASDDPAPKKESYATPAVVKAVPAGPDAVTAGATNASDEGSADTCGSRGGQKCKPGSCCSAVGYCGTSDEYCGIGCDPKFGTCSASSKRLRSRVRFHSHIMRRKSFNN